MHQQIEEDGEELRGEVVIPRYFIFVGCPGCDDCSEHGTLTGWDTLASTGDNLEEMRAACLTIPERLWWQLVDISNGRVILRSTGGKIEKGRVH
jgi:hypothetical protein